MVGVFFNFYCECMNIGVVIVGVDCVVCNGDIVNKIGIYQLVVLVCYYGVKFVVVVLIISIDFEMGNGSVIEIEECKCEELI